MIWIPLFLLPFILEEIKQLPDLVDFVMFCLIFCIYFDLCVCFEYGVFYRVPLSVCLRAAMSGLLTLVFV